MSRLIIVVVFLMIAGGCGSHPQDEAVEFVGKLGGRVLRDENRPGKPVTEVTLRGTAMTDADMSALASLKDLTSLDLFRTGVTDACLGELTALKELTALNLGGTRVTDAGLHTLATCENLSVLDLHYTKVSDTGLKELATLKNLTLLNVYDTEVTDSGWKEFHEALPNCRILARQVDHSDDEGSQRTD